MPLLVDHRKRPTLEKINVPKKHGQYSTTGYARSDRSVLMRFIYALRSNLELVLHSENVLAHALGVAVRGPEQCLEVRRRYYLSQAA